MPEIIVDGARVNFDRRVGGPHAIVFLHGGFGSSSELWTRTMAALPARYSAYALNNFVRSDPPPGGYNVAAFARRVAGFIRALDLGRPVLVGHSMGGVVSQLTALDYPDRVAGLVLVCTGASMRNHELGRRLLTQMKSEGIAADTIRSVSANWFHRPPPDGFFEGYVARASTVPAQAMIDAQESLLATDLESRLADIGVPALVVFGAHDTGRTFDHAQTLLRGIAGSRLAVMPDSGHSPMLETPDDFDAQFHRFLAESVWPEPAGQDHQPELSLSSRPRSAL
jgi:pimeloyl-ACP methyl ester carboxylesterase